MNPAETPSQAAAIAVRGDPGAVEVCLIRKRSSEKWGIPKGVIDPGETPAQTASKETWEEAGLFGKVAGLPVGTYTYEKWGTVQTVAVYVMRVHKEEPEWPEAGFRERRWCSVREAGRLLAAHPARALLDSVLPSLDPRR